MSHNIWVAETTFSSLLPSTSLPHSVATPTEALDPGITSLGCFFDVRDHRQLDWGATLGSMNSPALCSQKCASENWAQGPFFFGLQYGVECWCGTSVSRLDLRAHPTECNSHCPGNRELLCGGSYCMNIYGPTSLPASTSMGLGSMTVTSTSTTPTSSTLVASAPKVTRTHGLSKGGIAGLLVGVSVIILLLGLLWYWRRLRKQQGNTRTGTDASSSPLDEDFPSKDHVFSSKIPLQDLQNHLRPPPYAVATQGEHSTRQIPITENLTGHRDLGFTQWYPWYSNDQRTTELE